MSNDWKDQDWADLLACMRRRKVIPVIGEELLQVEIEGKTVPLYTWMAKRLASELGVAASEADVAASELQLPAALNDVACRYLMRSDSHRNTIYKSKVVVRERLKSVISASWHSGAGARAAADSPIPTRKGGHDRAWLRHSGYERN